MESLPGVPDILYKYRVWEDPNHKRILTNNELYFPSADLFNDPFDSSLPFRYNENEMTDENIIKKLVLLGRSKWPEISDEELLRRANEQIKEVDFRSDKFWKDGSAPINKRLHETFGICSLTPKSDNLLMWSHYANSHKGFCIGFNKDELYSSVNGMLAKVNYSENMPRIPMFSVGNETLPILLSTKSSHWEYEEEYRIVKVFAANKVFKLNDAAFKEIIFGCRMNPESKQEIIKIAKSKSSKIRLYDSVIDDQKFKLNIVEIK